MKLLVIAGNTITRYVGRKRDIALVINDWDGDFREFFERLRLEGEKAL